VAAATDAAEFHVLAETYARRLAAHAGEHADTFARYVGARLESTRTIGRHG
jgi:hypothetical protein